MSIDSIKAFSPNSVMDAAATKSPDLQSLSDKFSKAMGPEHAEAGATEHQASAEHSTMGEYIAAQEKAMRDTMEKMHDFSAKAPQMDMQEANAKHIELTYQMAMTQVQFNAGVQVAQSAKSGLQTLMKNQ